MKIVVYTLGCKVNQYESDSLSLALENNGHVVSNKLEHADIYIVNTCAVTSEAERKSRQVISKIKKLNPDAKICICGCASERDSSKFKDLENVRFISGVANKLKIVEKIEKYASSKRKSQKNCLIEIEKLPNEYNENYLSKPSKTRAFIKIQDGCNNFCTYCVIPYLRGRSRSRNVVEILNEIDQLQPTVKEIVLTGIDISDFKIDGEPALGKLLTMLKNNNVRVRLGSLEQGVISKEFLQSLEGIPNLCPHFHLSLQSGSESVLKRMNRHYTPAQFFDAVKRIRKIYVNPAITTDVIVGFPEETDEEFLETVKFIKKVKFANMHIFPYSKRDGTVAAKYKDVDGNIKRQRVKMLEELNEKLRADYIKKSIKTPHSVLIEEKDGDYYIGHSENYIKCYIKTDKNFLLNSFVNVKIKEKFLDGALAQVV